jgi:hypothetical protein
LSIVCVIAVVLLTDNLAAEEYLRGVSTAKARMATRCLPA